MNRFQRRRQKTSKHNINQELNLDLEQVKKKVLKNELKEAAELCQDVMASNPLNAEPYHLYALILLRQNKLQEAGKNILEAITRNDTDPQIHGDCGGIMNMLGRYEEGEAASRYAIELKSKNFTALCNLAVSLQMQGKLDEARGTYDEALSLNPSDEKIKTNLANLMVASGDLVSAIEIYSKLLEINPNDAKILSNLSLALQNIGELNVGYTFAQRALDADKSHADAHFAFGSIHLSRRRLDQAAASFKQAINLRSSFAKAECALSETYFYLGQEQKYKTAAKKAFRLAPNSGHSLYLISKAHKWNVTQEENASLLKLTSNNKFGLDDQIYTYRALGEIERKNQNFSESLDFFKKANQLQIDKLEKNEITFHTSSLVDKISRITDFFATNSLSRFTDPGDMDIRPVIITGGSALGLEVIAKALPGNYAGNQNILHSLIDDYPNSLTKPSSNHLNALVKSFMEYFHTKKHSSKNPILSDPNDIFYLGLIQKLFPKTRFLHFYSGKDVSVLNSFLYDFSPLRPWNSSITSANEYYTQENRMLNFWRENYNIDISIFDLQETIASWDVAKIKIEESLNEKISRKLNPYLSNLLLWRLSDRRIIPYLFD